MTSGDFIGILRLVYSGRTIGTIVTPNDFSIKFFEFARVFRLTIFFDLLGFLVRIPPFTFPHFSVQGANQIFEIPITRHGIPKNEPEYTIKHGNPK